MSEDPAGGAEIDASLSIAIGGMAAELRRGNNFRQLQASAISQPVVAGQVPLSGGAGSLDLPDQLQAKPGYFWGIRRMTLSGFTAGTVYAYRNSFNGEVLVPYPQAATFTFGRGEMLLHPSDRVVFAASGITGAVNFWIAFDLFEAWYLPFYIG